MAHERLEAARENVLKVLQGELTPDSHPAYFEDDLFYFDINVVEREDYDWLEGELSSETHTLERRLAVATQLYGERRAAVLMPLIARYREQTPE